MANRLAVNILNLILYRLEASRTYSLARYSLLCHEDGLIFTGPCGKTY